MKGFPVFFTVHSCIHAAHMKIVRRKCHHRRKKKISDMHHKRHKAGACVWVTMEIKSIFVYWCCSSSTVLVWCLSVSELRQKSFVSCISGLCLLSNNMSNQSLQFPKQTKWLLTSTTLKEKRLWTRISAECKYNKTIEQMSHLHSMCLTPVIKQTGMSLVLLCTKCMILSNTEVIFNTVMWW